MHTTNAKYAQIPQIAVIIVTYNGEQWIDACLQSVQASSIDCSIIVIDNASIDATTEILEKRFHEITLIKLNENTGFAQANNLGIATALDQNADFVFLLNQDAKIDRLCIENLSNAMNDHSKLGIASPVHYDYQGNDLDNGFVWYLEESRSTYLNDREIKDVKDLYFVKSVPAALWLVRSEALKEVGGFDPIFFLYGEDDDLAKRMLEKKWTIAVVPTAVGRHAHTKHETTRQRRRKLVRGYFAIFVGVLKQSDVSVARRCARIAIVAMRCIYDAAKRGDISKIFCVAAAGVKTIAALKQLRKSIREQRREYAFIDKNGDS